MYFLFSMPVVYWLHPLHRQVLMRLRMLKLSIGKGRQVIKQLCCSIALQWLQSAWHVFFRALVKGTVSGYKGRVSLNIFINIWNQLHNMTSGTHKRRQYRWLHGTYHTHSYRSIEPLICTLWWQVSTKMKTKYRKEKQTDISAPLSILAMSISPCMKHTCGWN